MEWLKAHKQILIWAVLGIVIILVAVFLASCKEGDIPFTMDEYDKEFRDQANDWGIPDEDTNFKYEYTTPGGIKINSVVPVPAAFLGYADEAAQRQVARFAEMFPAWSNARDIRGRRIFIVVPGRLRQVDGTAGPHCVTEQDDPGAPCLFISGYKAAAATFGCNDLWQKMDQNPPIVLPHQQFQNWQYVQWFKNSVEYEFEHHSGWMNRQNAPTGVFYHFLGANDVHPWMWGDSGAESLAGKQARWHCILK
jgi:hypothetical protein